MAHVHVDKQAMMDRFEKACKAAGLRITHQRTRIFEALMEHPGHPTTEDVFMRVRRQLRTISLDTVYRTIATFEEFGLIKKIRRVDGATHLDINTANHHHLICSRCHTIEDFYWPEFDRMKPPKSVSHWAQTDVKHVIMNGLCSKCKEEL